MRKIAAGTFQGGSRDDTNVLPTTIVAVRKIVRKRIRISTRRLWAINLIAAIRYLGDPHWCEIKKAEKFLREMKTDAFHRTYQQLLKPNGSAEAEVFRFLGHEPTTRDLFVLWALAGRETARMLREHGVDSETGRAIGFEGEDETSSCIVREMKDASPERKVSA